jgi:hypothetical protein
LRVGEKKSRAFTAPARASRIVYRYPFKAQGSPAADQPRRKLGIAALNRPSPPGVRGITAATSILCDTHSGASRDAIVLNDRDFMNSFDFNKRASRPEIPVGGNR